MILNTNENIIEELRAKELPYLLKSGEAKESACILTVVPCEGGWQTDGRDMTQWDLLVLLSKLSREDLSVLVAQVAEFPHMHDVKQAANEVGDRIREEQEGLREIMQTLLRGVSREVEVSETAKLSWADVDRFAEILIDRLIKLEMLVSLQNDTIDAEYDASSTEELVELQNVIRDQLRGPAEYACAELVEYASADLRKQDEKIKELLGDHERLTKERDDAREALREAFSTSAIERRQ
jgi:hypothetical protein